ncbi:glutamate--cysteine ligase [Lactiplantibacillus modestisalitolerans]|uniref:Glutamate--cysteine ligase n=1 Tax=Lactiplantibacillus modestisalitolerans TaxID=1457219 RepID=A0ABV5WWX4_9LACO|nr:glutamate--cysteine ligase [Lactiplantibacillus modestisalitolerans]
MDFERLMRQTAASLDWSALQFGLEREGQRVTLAGQLATTTTPPALVAAAPRIQRDFAETQLELVTPVTTSPQAAVAELARLHRLVAQALPANELVWPLSMPPVLPAEANGIQLARLTPTEVAYRQGLAQRYGRRRQMLSGLHVNVSLARPVVTALWAAAGQPLTRREFQNQLYLHVAQNYLHYRWLATYLFGCSPQSWPNYFTHTPAPSQAVRSLRNSPYGYENDATVTVSYASLDQYVADIQHWVRVGALSAAKEFYGHVRLRTTPDSDIRQTGISHLEIRHFDLNPFAVTGVSDLQLTWLRWFFWLMLWLPTPVPRQVDQWVRSGDRHNGIVALMAPAQELTPALAAEATTLLAQSDRMLMIAGGERAQAVVAVTAGALRTPERTLAARWQRLVGQLGATPAALLRARVARRELASS